MVASIPVAANIESLCARIATAAVRAGRDASAVKLIGASAASKGVTDEMVVAALDAGLRDFGENYIQEAKERIANLGERASEANWHFIGHLQTNKAGLAATLFDTIESVDSLKLAQALSRRAHSPLRLLLEVNVSGETSKHGLAPHEVAATVDSAGALPNIELVGLMTMAPDVDDVEQTRPVFRTLRQLAEANGISELSMGMTNDFEVAVEEGATMVRIGRALFAGAPQ
ncbi:MAG: YggS family pyridoxal phosphate-dependent enzyme [Alphaproteobacteria bacterium]|nr:YggS family pyridoxal phosphate-dependent enzyme [Alphaproteobacteria bacterium]